MKRQRSVKALGRSTQIVLEAGRTVFVLTLVLFILTAVAPALNAQSTQRTLTGLVTDDGGSPLVGVVVIAAGTSAGTVTNYDGTFSVNVPANAPLLQFSYPGMETRETAIDSTVHFNVILEPDSIGINEVVVVGYGTLAKKDVSTSIGSVAGENLVDRTSAFNVMQSLAGKVAGVRAIQSSGRPGGGTALRVRGMGSINAGTDPIYVLDGVIGVDPDIINVANIESIEVLKDAAATAMYGAQGSNGVVLITTKKGKKGTGTFTYDARVGIGFMNRRMDLLNADEFMQVQERAYAYSGKTMPHLIPSAYGPSDQYLKIFYYAKDSAGNYKLDNNGNYIASPIYDTDWQSVVTQKAITNDHILSFSTATDRMSIYASVGYQDQQGLVKETYSNRLTGTVNLSAQLNDWINIRAMATTGTNKGNNMEGGMGQGPIRNMIEMPPIVPVRYTAGDYADGSWGRKNDYPFGEEAENPVRLLQEQKALWNANFSVFNLSATANLAKGLKFTTQGDFQMNNRKTMNYAKEDMLAVTQTSGATANLAESNGKKMASENYFTYDGRFFDDKLVSNFVAGASWYYDYSENFGVNTNQYFDDFFEYHNLGVATNRGSASSGMTKKTMNSYYFRMNHSFMDRYLLGFSFRADGASNFGTNNKFGYFPSASVAWRISEEDFFAAAKGVVSNMKFRLCYGAVGNSSIPAYRTIAQYSSSSNLILNGTANPYVTLSSMPNANLRWETTNQFNAGLDLSFWNNRLELIMDYYNKATKDMLFQKQVSYVYGYTNMWTNLGKIRNTGFEVTLSSRNIKTNNFLWTTNVIFATNKIIVVDINGETISLGNDTVAREGLPWGSYNVFDRIGTWGLAEVEEASLSGIKI